MGLSSHTGAVGVELGRLAQDPTPHEARSATAVVAGLLCALVLLRHGRKETDDG
jgi:hypothetical protein